VTVEQRSVQPVYFFSSRLKLWHMNQLMEVAVILFIQCAQSAAFL